MKKPLISMLLLTAALMAPMGVCAQAPAVWGPPEAAQQVSKYYGVEVARFPSEPLARGVQRSLSDLGWAPVFTQRDESGETAVVVGEVASLGEAHALAEELRLQDIPNAKVVVVLEGSGPQPRGAYGALFLPPFTPSPGLKVESPLTAEQVRERMQAASRQVQSENEDSNPAAEIRTAIELWQNNETGNPALGRGAVQTVDFFYAKQGEPEAVLFLASQVARGDWAASAEDRQRAQLVAAEMLYGHRRDWRAAWQAARFLENQNYSADVTSQMLLRQAALLVELIDRQANPAPAWASVRALLRRAHEAAPADAARTRAQAELVYLQTYAWEGNWARVEELAKAFSASHPEAPGMTAMARIYLAQSLERTRSYELARNILTGVSSMELKAGDMPSMGYKSLDPRDLARERLRYFTQLSVGADPQAALLPTPTPSPTADARNNEASEEEEE